MQDYYFFKGDTDVLLDKQGRDVMDAALEYLKANDMWNSSIFVCVVVLWFLCLSALVQDVRSDNNEDVAGDVDIDDEKEVLTCGMCRRKLAFHMNDPRKRTRLSVGDLSVSGDWHCESCALKPLALYTTWISLGNARPSNSILAVCPGTHRLANWDMPSLGKQV